MNYVVTAVNYEGCAHREIISKVFDSELKALNFKGEVMDKVYLAEVEAFCVKCDDILFSVIADKIQYLRGRVIPPQGIPKRKGGIGQ